MKKEPFDGLRRSAGTARTAAEVNLGSLAPLDEAIPELRNMANRINLPRSEMLGWSYNSGGVWQCAMDSVIWTGNTSVSPLLQGLRDTIEAGNTAPSGKKYTGGLSMKLTMDLHRPQPESQFINGDSFCYGRLSGTFGPMLEGDAASYAPSRRLVPAATPNGAPPNMPTAFTTVIDKQGKTQHYFSADMGNSLYLKRQTVNNSAIGYLSLGDYETPDGYHFGYMATPTSLGNVRHDVPHGPDYQPFANGKVDFSALHKSMPSQYKNVTMQINSGVVFFQVSEDEVNNAGNVPLVCFLNQAALFSEASDGFSIDVETFTSRLEQAYVDSGQNWDKLIGPNQLAVQVHHFGSLYKNKTLDLEMAVQNGTGTSSDAPFITLTSNPTTTDGDGKLIYTFEASSATMTLGRLRSELGSNVAFVASKTSLLISDSNSNLPMSVVVWIKFTQPEPVTWDNDIGPILAEYAKLYPGMKAKLNIANEELVLGSYNGTMIGHMSADPQTPNYMPVTRDLSPSRVGMVLSYLKANKQTGGSDAQV